MIVDSALYRDGVRVDVDCGVGDLGALRKQADTERSFVWVGLYQPEMAELAQIAEVFDLHPLAVEDAVSAHQRPKLERYDDYLFLTLKTLSYDDAEDAVETGEIAMFVGANFVVTVRHGSGEGLHDTRVGLEGRSHVLVHGPSSVVYAVCDSVVDAYEHVTACLETDVDEVETSVFSPARTDDSARIYTLKREIAEVRRAVLPLREPMRRFASGLVTGIDPDAAPFFRDVADHLSRTAEAIDALDALLSTAFEAALARISVQQNEDMRKISAGAALVVVPTLIAGIYGMNFTHIPELDWTLGYPFALALMFGISLGLLWWFKRSGWL